AARQAGADRVQEVTGIENSPSAAQHGFLAPQDAPGKPQARREIGVVGEHQRPWEIEISGESDPFRQISPCNLLGQIRDGSIAGDDYFVERWDEVRHAVVTV